MAYTIIRSDGNTLTIIQDNTINTTSSSLTMPGRNYAGYGQYLNTNMVRQLESWANSAPPANPLRGQLWYDTNSQVLKVCPADNTTTASSWMSLAVTSSSGSTTFGNITLTGNLDANNISVTGSIDADEITVRLATVTELLTVGEGANSELNRAHIVTTETQFITAGSPTDTGVLEGTWTIHGGYNGNALVIEGGNMIVDGIRATNYYNADGSAYVPTGTYSNANVASYLPTYTGDLHGASVTVNRIAGGGTIEGAWTLTAGSTIEATYADLAERFEADAYYDEGTVVEIGGIKEVTSVKEELSDDVFGVVSKKAAYLLNARAGTDETHPAIAMSGRVPVKVTGVVKKGDRLVSAGNGVARSATKSEINAFNTIGRSLENKKSTGLGTVLAIVKVKV